jgi:curved DNA-binding protein CbpA
MNYYEVLGIPEAADGNTTRRAFRTGVRRYHRDAGAGSSAEKFREIVDAYETLRDPARRAAYDSSLQASRNKACRPAVEPIRVEPAESRPRSRDRYSFNDDVLSRPAQLFARVLDDFFFGRSFERGFAKGWNS